MYLLKQIKVNNLEEKIDEFNGIEFMEFDKSDQFCKISSFFTLSRE